MDVMLGTPGSIDVADDNSTLNDPIVRHLDLLFHALIALYIPLIIVINTLVFWGIALYPGFNHSNNIFLLCLSVYDFLVGAFAMPIYLIRYFNLEAVDGNKHMCMLRFFSLTLSLLGSLYSLLIITIDRYLSIIFPLRYKNWITAERAKKMVVAFCIFNAFQASIPMMGWNYYDYRVPLQDRCVFFHVLHKVYTKVLVFLLGLMCVIISSILNIHIGIIVMRQVKSFAKESSVWTSDQIRSFRSRINSIKVTIALNVLYIVLWAPFFLDSPMKLYNVLSKRDSAILRYVSLLMVYSSSIYNGMIYATMRKEFRQVYWIMLTNPPWRWRFRLRLYHKGYHSIVGTSTDRSSAVVIFAPGENVSAAKEEEERISEAASTKETVVSTAREAEVKSPGEEMVGTSVDQGQRHQKKVKAQEKEKVSSSIATSVFVVTYQPKKNGGAGGGAGGWGDQEGLIILVGEGGQQDLLYRGGGGGQQHGQSD
ncbi:adenosine receptor A2b-like [Physella acuta]|uniref:adenosine receptor A2b-like n=1 Tax=Physella acuta TaxID=109671 RepID=UPI0027DDD867|nr:adenosine receptor A2b-like [Physella acuta]